MSEIKRVNRRTFLERTGISVSGALILGVSTQAIPTLPLFAATKSWNPNVYIMIDKSGQVTIVNHRSEMGQGVRTSMPMLICEELGLSLSEVKQLQAEGDAKYGDQNTDGSTSIRINWDILRRAGATTRDLLLRAAAKKYKQKKSDLDIRNAKVFSKKTGKSYNFGDLIETAKTLKANPKVKLKPASQFKIIGRTQRIYDGRDIVTGKSEYGIDVERPGMLFATIERSPTRDGKVTSFDEKAAMAVKGVKKIVRTEAVGPDINCNNGVAVVATNTWAAYQGREKLNPKFKNKGKESSSKFKKEMVKALEKNKLQNFRKEGKKPSKGQKSTSSYYSPYLVHSPMEPLVAVAEVKKNSCEVWAPTQHPQRVRTGIAKYLKIPEAKVRVNVTMLGGGFGRKSQPDFILEAVQVAKAVGKPVKLQWTREDEVRHGTYHATAFQKIETTVDKKNKKITGWHHKSSFPSISTLFNRASQVAAPFEMGMGAQELPYDIPYVKVDYGFVKSDLNIGWLRSVCHVWHAFAICSKFDEIASDLKVDTIKFVKDHLGKDRIAAINPREQAKDFPYKQDTGRMRKTIETLERNIKWKPKKGKNRGMGFAAHYSFHSYVAMAVDASVVSGQIKVNQVDVAVDCGTVVNPDNVKAQIEGGIVFGLSAALYGKVTLNNGVVEQSNFHDYQVLRHNEMPKVNVYLTNSKEIPTGIGEPGVPPVAPALANAIFQVTGKRLRDMPFSEAKLS